MTPYASGAGWDVYHGDMLRLLMDWPGGTVDGIVTDPPYSSGGMTRGDRAGVALDKYVRSENRDVRPDFTGDSRDQRSYAFWCSVWFSECLRTNGPHSPDDEAPCPPGFYTVPNRGERLHIAQKPLEVLTPLLGCVRPGGLVLDPFGGSGSTGVAALRTGRRAVLFDVMESNCDLMAERLTAEAAGVDVLGARAGALSLFGAA